ncbi:hypothetical protein KKF34_01075 [Myxococcota bacterium]|nr:hypothetical protein [Myxococcota bacterium]MBU1381544.1 hypothetical protein [Myxococcota bacterium]MBU1495454.1 hypothetical protein [Myxococcota bacterium]
MKPLPMALLIIAVFTAVVMLDNYPEGKQESENKMERVSEKNKEIQPVQVSSIRLDNQKQYSRD